MQKLYQTNPEIIPVYEVGEAVYVGHKPVIVKRAVIGSKRWMEAQHNIKVVRCFMIGQ